MNISPIPNDEAYKRLKALYGISKLLASLENIEKTFPEIVALATETFPLATAVLIQCRESEHKTSQWRSVNATPEQLVLAAKHAEIGCDYICGEMDDISSSVLDTGNHSNYVVLPLILNNLSPFGVLQLEGSSSLDEQDLEFVVALVDLLCVALDRKYIKKIEADSQREQTKKSTDTIDRSNEKILGLETERALRESFVSLLSHDLRTPLSVAKISAQLIQRRSSNPEACQNLALKISHSIDRADEMIRNLLDANRIRSGEKLPLNLEHFEMSSFVQETLLDLATVHGDRFVLKPSEKIEGFWDTQNVRRVIENLCNNAIKYGSNSPVILSLEAADKFVKICVHNNGSIISEEDQKSLFQQFRRSHEAEESGKKGWGIGLTLVQGVAEAHGGNVSVKSEAGTGTIFTVTLPIDARPFVHK
jgi:signal transduction histidine kinase